MLCVSCDQEAVDEILVKWAIFSGHAPGQDSSSRRKMGRRNFHVPVAGDRRSPSRPTRRNTGRCWLRAMK